MTDTTTTSANTAGLDHGERVTPDSGLSLQEQDLFHHELDTWEPNNEEKELLRRSWSDDFDFLYQLGANIYEFIFARNHNTKQLFPAIHAHGENYRDSREFRTQALKFVQTLSQVVKNLYDMPRLASQLYGIGTRHVKYVDRGFRSSYWDIFQDAMEVSLSGHIASLTDLADEERAKTTRVWRTLALYVIVHMKHGFYEGLRAAGKREMRQIQGD